MKWLSTVQNVRRAGDFTRPETGLRRSARMRQLTGGVGITEAQANELRKLVLGSTYNMFSPDWRRAAFTFRNVESQLPFGMEGARNGSRAVITCVQAYVMKYLLFDREKVTKEGVIIKVLSPGISERRTALAHALATMLWHAGDHKKSVVCLPKDVCGFDNPQSNFRQDGLTEMLYLWEFTSKENMTKFITKFLDYFEDESWSGCCLFLYSMILSRTIEGVKEDFGNANDADHKLLDDAEDPYQSLTNLMLTGRASPYLHNGLLVYDDEGRALRRPLQGIHARSDVGFFIWTRVEVDNHRTEVGSMLKTPRRPIWVTLINGQFGLLFSTNLNLMRDWRVEHRFNLHYYTIKATQTEDCVLSVDTRLSRSTKGGAPDEKRRLPAVEQCIQMKWAESQVFWNGTAPFI